jgi:hypothetical protein
MNAISLGQPAAGGTIAAAGQVDCYPFDGTIGDRVHIDVNATDGTLVPSTSVVDGSGNTVCAPTTDVDQVCRLTASGSDAIVVQDATATNTGDYTIFAELLPVTCTSTSTIGFGTKAKVGSIDGDDVTLCYSFQARARNKVRVRVVPVSGSLVPSVSVAGPGGGTACGPSTAVEQTCVISATGLNTVVVRDQLGTNTGTFGVYIQRLTFPLRCTSISFGAPAAAATIAVPGDADCYLFRTGGSRHVRVRVVSTDGAFQPSTEIVDSAGTTTCGPSAAVEVMCKLASSHRNRMILVRDALGPNIGSYTISVQEFPPSVNCGQIRVGATPQTGAITIPGNVDCYTFQGTAGHHLRVRVVGLDGTLVPYSEVVNGNGTTVCGPATGVELVCKLSSSGRKTILIRDFAGPNTGDYAVYLQDLNAPPRCGAVNINDPALTGSITDAGDARCYTFAGNGGQNVRVDISATSGTIAPLTEIVSPAGASLCGPSTDTEQVCKLPASGTFMIFVRDATGPGTGTFTVAANSP